MKLDYNDGQNGFVKVAAATPDIQVADCNYNADKICELIDQMQQESVKLLVFPELCITGYTCSDLFWQQLMLENAKKQLVRIARYTEGKDMLVFVGLPLEVEEKLYNVAAALYEGKILGIVPKIHLPNYSEFYEARHFASGKGMCTTVCIGNEMIPFSPDLIFKAENLKGFLVAAEICEDLWVPDPPSTRYALNGATIIVNLSASDEITGKESYRRNLIKSQSARLICGYIYADAGEGESTTDFVYAGHNLISENGTILKESKRFVNEAIITDLDLDKLVNERRRMTTFSCNRSLDIQVISFRFKHPQNQLEREIDFAPFIPSDSADRTKRCEEIFTIQAMGLKKRLAHAHCKSAVIGISGGLDSTLALLVAVRAMDLLNMPRKFIIAVTMPGFGTTDRTYQNALTLIKNLGCTLKEISITPAVLQHFKDIGHDLDVHDITYENAQARQRTYLLMNIANQTGGIVIGTGDMSELALGWATYNGDHMSMYGVNASVPKTLVRHLVRYYADISDENLKQVLYDVLDTPVSPELLPPEENGDIAQKTEDLVGPYELHDFFLYYILRFGYTPKKIYLLAKRAFQEKYTDDTILKWLKVFYKRFFMQQFKRSCLPDGPKVGTVAVSPRGDLRMPSDAVVREWLEELEQASRLN